MLQLPDDYNSFKESVLWDQQLDDQGLYEVWWAANSRYPALALSSRLAVAEAAVSDLLSDGRVRLVRGPWTGPAGERETVENPFAALLDWETWVLGPGQLVVWMRRLTRGSPLAHGVT